MLAVMGQKFSVSCSTFQLDILGVAQIPPTRLGLLFKYNLNAH